MRNLERELSTLIRKAVKELTLEKTKSIAIDAKKLDDYLGVPKYRYGEIEADDLVGVVTGLAWTDVGGELLTIEGVMMPGKGRMTVTGNLRDVMKESISAAASYVRSRAITFGIEPPMFDKRDIHVHVPEGATPKDGPSAGVAMVTAIVSTLTGIPVRKDVAMTGEITLRGRILPIGGLKEKLLAAHRGGIKTVLIPEENAKDLTEISDSIKGGLRDHPGLAHGRGAQGRARSRARADPVGRDRQAGHDIGRCRGRGGWLGSHRALRRFATSTQNGGALGAAVFVWPAVPLGLTDHDAHAGDPLRHQMVVAQLRTRIAHLLGGGRRPPPRFAPHARRNPRRGRSRRRSCVSKSLKPGADEASQEIAIPLLAWRQARSAAVDELARGLDDAALAGVESAWVGVARSTRRWVLSGSLWSMRGVGGSCDRPPEPITVIAHVLVREELADRGAEGAHAAERGAGIGGAVDEHRQHVVAVERAGQLVAAGW